MVMGQGHDFPSSIGEWSLEPLEGEAIAPGAPQAPVKFHCNTRSNTDRRVLADRRQMFRLEPDRRSGKSRRPKTSWEPGRNI
jgi:hypothetical protein